MAEGRLALGQALFHITLQSAASSNITAFCSCLAQGVAEGRQTVGDAVLFITLMQQLYVPLNYFANYCAPWPFVSLSLC